MKLNLVDDFEVDIDMSPMIDMVFLLLIFFIVAAAMVEVKVPVALPAASAAKVPDEVTGRLNLSVGVDETIYIGSVPVSRDELKKQLSLELDANPNLRVFIRSDENVPYRINRSIMAACAEMGAVNLIYAAFEE